MLKKEFKTAQNWGLSCLNWAGKKGKLNKKESCYLMKSVRLKFFLPYDLWSQLYLPYECVQ